MSEDQVAGNIKSGFQRKYRDNQHKEFVKKEKERKKATLPPGARKINGRIYSHHKSFEKRSDAEKEAMELKGNNLTHIEKYKNKWNIYLFSI